MVSQPKNVSNLSAEEKRALLAQLLEQKKQSVTPNTVTKAEIPAEYYDFKLSPEYG